MFFSKKLLSFKNLKHCFFSRKGGFSKGIYKSLNCGRGSKDSKKIVLKNIKYVSKKINSNVNTIVLMHQTHSNKVVEIDKKNYFKKIKSDAIITSVKGLTLGVVTADCVPVLLYDCTNKVAGCIHAGWKGTLSGIIKKTILKIKNKNSNCKIYASVGPCIGKKNYEVDLDFFRKFKKKSLINKKYFSKKNKNKMLFNLRKLVADKLTELGVVIDHINHDTFDDANNFFSFRRSCKLKQKDYGRCISVIKLLD